jgi:hypothetical protein
VKSKNDHRLSQMRKRESKKIQRVITVSGYLKEEDYNSHILLINLKQPSSYCIQISFCTKLGFIIISDILFVEPKAKVCSGIVRKCK